MDNGIWKAHNAAVGIAVRVTPASCRIAHGAWAMRILPFLLVFLTSACAGLLVHQDDPTAVVAAKAVWRTVLGVSTLGFSEVRMSALRDAANAEALADQRLQDYEWHLTYLVNNSALSQAEAEDLYQRYAALVWQESLDVAGGMEPVGYSSSYSYSTYGPGLWAGGPWYGLASASRYPRGVAMVGQPQNGYLWSSHDNFARISAMARARANATRWSRFSGGSRGFYFRGGGSKGSGRRGGGRR